MDKEPHLKESPRLVEEDEFYARMNSPREIIKKAVEEGGNTRSGSRRIGVGQHRL